MRNVVLAIGLASILALGACKKKDDADTMATEPTPAADPAAPATEAPAAAPESLPPCDPNDPAATNCTPAAPAP